MSQKLSIKELESLSGIKAHTLRIWEQRYGILKPERTDTNIRYYNNDDLKRILNISLLNHNGYKISKIAEYSYEQLLLEAEKFLNDFTKESYQIENLTLCLMDLDDDRFEKTVNSSIIHFGFENTIEKILFPFLRQMGNMWQVGMINPAQEHYISNLIRQKLIVGIDKLSPNPIQQPKTILFFLPNDELHEMGLLYTNFLCKSKGHKCIYLGQSVPFEDIVALCKTTKPDKIISIFTSKLKDITLNEYFKQLIDNIPEAEFLFSGRQLMVGEDKPEDFNPRIKLFEDFKDFKNLI
jgi:DNA-binding transcriptional MerR regulator